MSAATVRAPIRVNTVAIVPRYLVTGCPITCTNVAPVALVATTAIEPAVPTAKVLAVNSSLR